MSCLHLRWLVETGWKKKRADRLSSKAVWPLAARLSPYLTAFNFIWLSTWKSLAGLAAATVDTHTHTHTHTHFLTHTHSEISSHMASFKTPGIYCLCLSGQQSPLLEPQWRGTKKRVPVHLANMLTIHSTAIIAVKGVTGGHGWTGHWLIFSPHCEHLSLSKALIPNQPLLPFDTCIVLGASS